MLILRKKAEEDIRKAYEWYEEKRTNLGVEFISEVETVFDTIKENPKKNVVIFKTVRRALCKRFPYSIYFIDSKSNIIIVAVLHQKRNPEIWKRRGGLREFH